MKQGMAHDMNKDIVRMTAMTARIVLTGLILMITDGNAAAQTTGVIINGSVYGGGNEANVETNTTVTITKGTVAQDVFGGGKGQTTLVFGNVEVNIGKKTVDGSNTTFSGEGVINGSVYGGSALGSVNATTTPVVYTESNTTTVNLYKGTVKKNVYGGGLGQRAKPAEGNQPAVVAIPAYVGGTVTVELNHGVPSAEKGCIVEGKIFGCNNVNGSPKGNVTVHIYGTQSKDENKTKINTKFANDNINLESITEVDELKAILMDLIQKAKKLGITVTDYDAVNEDADATAADVKTAINSINEKIKTKTLDENTDLTAFNALIYDLKAVYGGGNEANYDPETPYNGTSGSKTEVIIEGCDETSIETVYGGGNAAAVPETNVEVRSAYEIYNVFGGGNGKDATSYGTNPGADVGTKDLGASRYGTGNVNSKLNGGYIHEAYGASNQKGIIKGSLNQTTKSEDSSCKLVMDKIVGAGKYADIDADVNMTLDCQPDRKVDLLFAGADEANVNGNITLTITNGHFGKVFGGNNLGGAIKGKIVVNVEETGCQPIKIDDLYLGSNKAAYSVFGYYISNDVHPVTGKKILKPRESATDQHLPVKLDGTEYASIEDFTNYDQPVLNIISCTYIGNVFGGGLGKEAKMYANPTVDINMVKGGFGDDENIGVPKVMTELGLNAADNPNHVGIIRNVYGGGDAADIEGNTTVNIAVKYVVKQVTVGADVTSYYTRNNDGTYTAATGTAVEGTTYYEKKDVPGTAYIIGSVFGGGNAADVLGNTNVTMSDGYVFNGIFGGGYAGNVGTFTRSTASSDVNIYGHTTHDGCIGKPVSCAANTGKCTVLVNGGQIGPYTVATLGMNRPKAQGGPVPEGWVWGAGQGLVEDPATNPDTHFKSYVGSTDVTIGGTAFVLESIIGGGEFGRVLGDTKVTIQENCQIGVGEGMVENGKPIRYTDDQFIDPTTTEVTSTNALAECSHFPYGEDTNNDGIKDKFLPYDPYYDKYLAKNSSLATSDLGPASTSHPSDGKTWIGCVFAGGSGYMPYEKEDGSGYDWCSSAGLVEGNTNLTISGGHILTNVYGGNEVTNVKGTCKVTMTGGTIGVPRTVQQIIDHPLTCYLFGAGKGDQRKHFNKETNVGDVEVTVTGGIIYGSVFGGGEDGHVLRDVKMTIGDDSHNGPKIGTWGTSYVDGNVFGGGRGFGGDAYTAGNVAGSVDVDIKGGTILGSIYGGGRLGSVGYGLYNATTGGNPTPGYGEMRDDDKYDDGTDGSAFFTNGRGHIDITISGGTIGNTHEYIIPSASNTPSSLNINIDDIASWTDDNWKTWKTYNNIPLTEFDHASYRLKHTKGGNVFTGGMGRRFMLDGVTEIDETTDGIDWKKLGNVKSTKLTISGDAQIKIMGNVYGGGELGAVTGNHKIFNGTTPVTDTNGNPVVAGTEIIINGGNSVIGTEVGTGSDKYYFGSVYGGGMGVVYQDENDAYVLAGGNVADSTKVSMSNGSVRGSVYGGGELGQVSGSANVAVSGGTIGVSGFGGAEYGNIYGGGRGSTDKVDAGLIKTNTWVTVSGSPQIWHNIYGGGAYGSVGEFNYDTTTGLPTGQANTAGGTATVTVKGGTIGRNGKDNGMIFGSSRGDVGAPGSIHDKLAWVYDTKVIIGTSGGDASTPLVRGSVYGGGENGHIFNDAAVTVHSGTIGIAVGGEIIDNNGTPDDDSDDITYKGAEYPYRGNVYGGGCGTDKYYRDPAQETHDGNGQLYNPLAGIVQGDASVSIDGGLVVHNVYGAGAMGSVGTMTKDANNHLAITNDGTTTVAISGGTIGVSGTVGVGNVYGAARGDSLYTEKGVAQVRSTSVTISQADGKTTMIYGNVYGGGETGDVGTYTNTYTSTGSKNYVWDKIDSKEIGGCSVSVTGGQIKGNVFGAGKGVANSFECEKAIVRTATVSVSAGTVNGNVYGGGEIGRVDQNTKVTIGDETATSGTSSPVIAGDVFGAGAGKETHGYSALVRGDAEVIIQGNAAVGKSVYGGGEIAAVGRYGLDSDNMPTTLVSGGECKVTVKGSAKIGTVSGGNVFGAGKGVNPFDDDYTYIDFTSNSESKWPKRMTIKPGAGQTLPVHYTEINGTDYIWEYYTSQEDYFKYLQTLALATDTKVSIEGSATVNGSVYGGSESGFVQRDTEIKIQGGEIGSADTNGTITTEGNVYGGGKGLSGFDNAGRVSGGVTIAVSDGQTHGDVYGGGELGVVKGAVLVNILGGTIDEDVYGGGALANTNTNNWNGTTLSETYLETSGLTVGTSSVVGYYTKSGDTYRAATGTAEANTKYYRKVNTAVNLFGGYIKGDAYGGGLGQKNGFNGANSDKDAIVYGDVDVTLGDAAGAATRFFIGHYADDASTTDNESKLVNSGRVFGCNNLKGSPMGNVTVTVNSTVMGNVERTPSSTKVYGYGKKLLDDPGYVSTYEVAAVYGGGNLAPYEAVGKNTHVIINGCEKTSIETVYGGGNAAAVPETKVDINGTYEIGAVFGGGNGKDKYKSDAGWVTNPGANVNGPTTTWIYGGTIHEAYGASNEKGTISGNASIDVGAVAASDPNYCRLDVGKVVGAGKNADVNGNIITILGCKPSEEIPIYYGGADNANVNGNVELTITSGNFGQVFGGNNLGGAIRGRIILNIEETGDCETPITIEKLYLGGNQATYSRYGYYVKTEETEAGTGKGASGETAVLTTGETKKLIFMPRTSATDSHLPVNKYGKDDQDKWTWTTTAIADFTPYEEPKMNVISCTRIDSIYGGGYGVGGDMYANPTVNINMIPGSHAATAITRAALNGAANDHRLGAIGAVFGGGDAADVIGNTTVNIGTATTVNLTSIPDDDTTPDVDESLRTVEGAYITGSVYGGGNKADVKGNTYVNICANQADDASTADVIEYAGVTVGGTGCEGVTIKGNVFGGGKGIADSFTCAKAMVGVIDTNNGDIDITKEVTGDGTSKGTRVSIGNGTVEGTVYGGGEVGRVEWNSVVTIGLPIENGTSEPVIDGSVFGAGKGVEQYGYAALVRGNTFVTIQEKAKVGHSVYGGGEIASVGKYKVVGGVPTSLANQGSGYCNVIVRGNAEIGPDNMVMYNTTTGKPDDWGHVFGAGKGILPYEDKDHFECLTHKGTDGHGLKHPGSMKSGTDSNPNGTWECYEGDEAKYLDFVETQALATQTEVVIGGNAFVKGSVYGGSENGHVQHSTHVTIQETCQIGAGYDKEQKKSLPKYAEAAFINPLTTPVTSENALAECAHWDYDKDSGSSWDMYATYQNTADGKYYYGTDFTDPTNDAKGGSYIAKDGHTFYGNVFGGGSGLIPYAPGKWHRAAGSVGGNTVVDITGGHILTSVYGGNEQTDVGTYKKDNNGALVVPVSGGKCTINMTGGTVGVPRTVTQINEHPVICYVFGAGKGDQRIFFNTWTNVINTEVNIGGNACIYGSVLGGGEDGHVIRDAVTNIGGTVEIGTEQIAHSGVVIGTTGTSYVDGNVFGGGRGFSGEAQTAGTVGGNVALTISGGNVLGSVYGGGRLASVGTEFTAPESPNYGQFMEDDADGTYGHVIVNIGGGTIGNGEDGKDVTSNVSGNVFGGSMGRLTLLNGTTINPLWPKMAQVKSSVVNIYGNAVVKRTVFGGGELGTVRDDAYVTIGGIKTSDADANGKVNIDKQGTPIVRRDVYGGGYGSEDYQTETTVTIYMAKDGGGYDPARFRYTPMQWAGCVGKNTYVNVVGGQVRKSVYGGGEMASVGIINSQLDANDNCIGIVKHDDEKNGFALSWPYEFTYFPGYPGDTHVTVTGGRIGLKGGETNPFEDLDNGDVIGGSKGIAGDFNDYVFCANVGSTDVTINYPNTADPSSYDSSGSDVECITGAVYGGAENGHVMGDTKVTLKKGLVGHSVYGGGSGKGKFSTKLLKIGAPANSTSESDYYTRDIYSITAGKVFGDTEVIMEDGYVVRNVYGGGNMGSVGKGNYAGGPDDYSTAGYGEKVKDYNLWDESNSYGEAFLKSGRSKVTILGGTVGYINPANPSESVYGGLPYGNVFGGCRGEAAPNISESPRYLYSPEFFVGYVNETDVTIGTVGQAGPKILGSVYGGGMDGHVRRDASVTINSGEIGSENGGLDNGNVYGAGSGIGKYEYDFNYDNDFDDIVEYNNGRATVATKEKDYSSSAGSVTRFTTVDIKGGTIHRNVYGGGSLSSVGAPKIGQDYDPYHPNDSKHSGEAGKLSLNKVSISGGQIGDDAGIAAGYGGDVNGGSRGESAFEESSLMSPSSFASSVWTDVTISGSADVKGSVFGGGEAGMVKHDTEVKMLGGIVGNDLYGGGDMADVGGSTTVSLTGGQITNAAYGGARGTADNAADVGGDVLVELNKGVAENAKGCIVDRIFGANNVNGTPKGHVKVHVHATQNKDQNDISTKSETKGIYDMTYVFGGGNASDYVPEDETQSTEVIIDGCGLTSIYEVYGGGYGAATPGTNVRINGTEIIDNVFGGGYGAGVGNPGANVGYRTDHSPYGLYLNDNKTKIAIVNLMAGKVNSVYGGSNTKGDIRNGAATETVDLVAAEGACPKLEVGELYGGGKNAEMEGGAEIILRCMPDSWIGEVYAGAREANVGNDVSLTITSGKFEHVYGGNKSSGKIDGYVEVNIEECPTCNTPVIIGELYGGGNEAAYNLDTEKYGKDYPSPRVNVRAFTSIGTIYGGGKGEGAKVTGNPTVSINVGMVDGGGYDYDPSEDKNKPDGVTLYSHEKGKIGVIGNVFGGGNAAEVNGSTNVLIGTESYVQINRIVAGETDLSNGDYYTRSRSGAGTEEDPYVYTYTKATGIAKENTVYYTPVIGVDIKGNVYGGGNNAGVTGNTNVTIGKEKVTTP